MSPQASLSRRADSSHAAESIVDGPSTQQTPNARDDNPSRDCDGDCDSEFTSDAHDGRADGDCVDVVDGACVLCGEGEGLHRPRSADAAGSFFLFGLLLLI